MEEKKKILNCASSNNLRKMIEFINSENLSKEDVLTFFKEGNEYMIMYYK